MQKHKDNTDPSRWASRTAVGALRGAGSPGVGCALVLEGALFPPGAAVIVQGEVAAQESLPGRRGAGGDLFDAARRVLVRVGLCSEQLEQVIVGCGPGSFTGLRVALGAARGLRFARAGALPLIGIDSLTVLAAAAGVAPSVRVALPWGRLRVLLARATPSGPQARARDLIPVEDLAERHELSGETVVIPPEARHLDWPAGVRLVETQMCPVEGLARCALATGGELAAWREADPVYLLAPDAVLPARASRLPPGRAFEVLALAQLDEALAVERACFDAPWSRRMLAEELSRDENGCVLGLRGAGDRLEATAFARWDDEALEILSLAVLPGTRRGGLGRTLVRRFVERARAESLRRVDLEVSEINAAALALYLSEGFVPVGRRRKYYPDGTDAILMSLVLRR